MFPQFLNDLISPTMDEAKGQPTSVATKTACLLFGGPLLTYRAFKQSGPQGLCGIANTKFSNAIQALQESRLSKVRTVQVCYASNPVTLFIKEDPEKIQWLSEFYSQTEYWSRFHQQVNKSITATIKRALIDADFLPQEMVPDV